MKSFGLATLDWETNAQKEKKNKKFLDMSIYGYVRAQKEGQETKRKTSQKV